MLNLAKITNVFESSNVKEALSYLKSYKFPASQSKKFKISALGLCALVLTLFTMPLLLDNSGLKFQIEQDISKSLGANFTINSKIDISFLPSMSISAKNVLLQNYGKGEKVYNFYAKSAIIDLSFLKLLAGEFAVKKVIFSSAILESYYSSNQPKRENKFTEIAEKIVKNSQTAPHEKPNSSLISKISVDNLDPSKIGSKNSMIFIVNNGESISYDKFSNKKEIQNIFGEIKISDNKIKSSGEFTNEQIINNFRFITSFNSSSMWDSSLLEISSSIFNLRIKGNFPSKNLGIFKSDFNGEIDAEILELKPFYKSYIGNNKAIYDKLKSGIHPIKIRGKIISNAGETSIQDIVINSNLINGKGSAELNLTFETPIIDIDLNLDNLNLDDIWSYDGIVLEKNSKNKKIAKTIVDETAETLPAIDVNTPSAPEAKTVEAVSHIIEEAKPLEKKIDFLPQKIVRSLDLTAEIKIKNIKYLDGELKDADLYLTNSKQGEIIVLPIIFKIPGEGTLRINGVLTQSNNIPKLIGRIDVVGKSLQDVFKWLHLESQNLKLDNLKEYILYSDILFTPNKISLNNLYLNLNSNQSELLGEINIDGSEKTLHIDNKFIISAFNVDDYFLISGQNIYLSPGSLLKKILWLNDISSNNKLDLVFDKLTYKGEDFFNQSIKLLFGQGYFEVSDLRLKSEETDLSANLKIDISDKNPYFEMNINAGSFHYKSLQSNKLFGIKDLESNAFDQFFSLPSLEDFSGVISLAIDDLSFDDLVIKNAKMGGNLEGGDIKDAQLSCDLYGGNLSYKGLIGIKYDKTINGNLSFNNAQLNEFLPLIDLKNISGISNISASITSSASKKSEFLSNIFSEIKFNANSPVVSQFGLDSLVRKMFDLKTYRQELRDLEAVLFNLESKTSLKKANGTIILNKDKDSKFKINIAGTASTGIISGKIDIISRKLDGLANIIFLTGDRRKQVPINIAISFKGGFSNIDHAANLDQAKQYLGIIKTSDQKSALPLEMNSRLINDPKSQDALSKIKEVMANPDSFKNQQVQP